MAQNETAQITLDASVEEQLRLSAFEGKFDVKEFIGTISERLIAQSKADAGPFDPSPFIQTFEAVVDKLISVRKDVQTKTEHMEKSVRVSEREYSKRMAELNRNFEAVGNSFDGMENKMNDVGRTAIRIGEQLESIHLERQRAQAAYDLIDMYGHFAKGNTDRIDALKKEGKEGRRQVAILLRRLVTVAKEVDLPDAEQTRERIDRYCEKFEKDILYLFDRSYRKGDPKMMHHCAQTLLDFNGGSSCVQVYVNQHHFFMNRASLPIDEGNTLTWSTIGDPDMSPPKTEPSLSALFGEIRATVEQEAEIVRVVFPNPPYVMQVLLQRIFAQSIQQQMETLLNQGASVSELAFLRILQLVHAQTTTLVDDLKTQELPVVVPRSPIDSSEFRRAIGGTGAAAAASGSNAAMGVMLDSAMEELFATYTEGQRYLDKECKCLTDLYAKLLSAFARYHTRTHAGKSTMLGRMMNQISSTGTSGTSSTAGSAAAAALMRFGGLGATATPLLADKPGEEPIREEDGQLSLDVAERMLKWHAEAIGRCVELSASADVPKNTFALLRVLSETLGNGYVGVALESALARLEAADPKAEPSLQPLTILRSVDLICHLWQQYANIALFPLASSSVTVRREMVVFNNQTISRIEGSANHVMQRVTDAVIAWLATQLAKQKRTDFKPRNDDMVFARVNTEPCAACCDILEKVRDSAKQNLSGRNLEVFLTEIGLAFHALLLDHMKKFPVSATGGLMLAKDIKSYQDVINTFSILALQERYEFLRQLGQIFLLTPEVLKSYITEDYLGRIDAALLKPYLAMRVDWGQQSEKAFNDGSAGPASVAPGSAGATSGGRFARLSMMMRDLDVNRLGEGMPTLANLPSMPAIPAGLSSSFNNRFSLSGTRAGM